MTLSMMQWAEIFGVSLMAAIAALLLSDFLARILSGRMRIRGQDTRPVAQVAGTGNRFLFEDDTLVDHDASDLPIALALPETMTDWAEMRDWLSRRFVGLPVTLSALPEGYAATFDATGIDPASCLSVQRLGHITRLSLTDAASHGAAKWHAAMISLETGSNAEVILASAPDPIWRTNPAGAVVWQNAACARIRDKTGCLPSSGSAEPGGKSIVSVESETGEANRWFELRTSADGNHHLHFATDITLSIKAETVQREFVQTLTKTFANLTIGLAIFDRNRQLALFNPALVDLTHVPVGFLSARPDLMQFFDQLRERQVMPEPKNYASWRAQIRDVVAQAKDGLYQEMWTLPNGLTYRVTGRPHPDGAVAFLFEDISAEISLTRRFRTQVELRQSVLDGMSDAVAVIGGNGVVMFCNTACRDLLRIDPDSSFADMSLRDLLQVCQTRFGNGPDWSDFAETVRTLPIHGTAETAIGLDTGLSLHCQIKPLPGGVRMLVFSATERTVRQTSLSVAS